MRPRQGLLGCADVEKMAHQERQIGARARDEVPLSDVLPTSKGGAAPSAAVEDMLEASFHDLASLSHPSTTGLGGYAGFRRLERCPVRPFQPVPSAPPLRVADCRLDAYTLKNRNVLGLEVPLVRCQIWASRTSPVVRSTTGTICPA